MTYSVRIFKLFKNCFTVACTIIAVYLCITCMHTYILDKDTSSVDFKNFHSDSRSLYPSATLCFTGLQLFLYGKLGYEFISGYEDFLLGSKFCDFDSSLEWTCLWNDSFVDTDYDDVTINLLDYVIGESTLFDDGTYTSYVYRKFPEKGIKVADKYKITYGYRGGKRVYSSSRMWNQKCIKFDIPL